MNQADSEAMATILRGMVGQWLTFALGPDAAHYDRERAKRAETLCLVVGKPRKLRADITRPDGSMYSTWFRTVDVLVDGETEPRPVAAERWVPGDHWADAYLRGCRG